MKKQYVMISCICLILALSPCGEAVNRDACVKTEAKQQYVYYVPNSSYAYHKTKGCRTLSRSKVIAKATVKKAKKKLGLRACKVCY